MYNVKHMFAIDVFRAAPSERFPEHLPDRFPERFLDHFAERLLKCVSECFPECCPDTFPDRYFPEYVLSSLHNGNTQVARHKCIAQGGLFRYKSAVPCT